MRPRSLAVLVPAHNEEDLLPGALDAIRAAARHPALRRVRVLTVVAADDCSDGTVAAAAQAGADVVRVTCRNVGLARAAAADRALELLDGPEGVWLASTDADSTVPPHWLAFQHARAVEGWDAVVGTVSVAEWPQHVPGLAARHQSHYVASRPAHGPWHHPHVHGANLGVCADAYLAVGGFPALPVSEDHGLVAALGARGHRILRTADCPVTTSGRLAPRAHGGFGDHLAGLALEESPAS
ncbi:glycosyltransferase [Streptomyces kunmingensis]|uniref:4,4'-diaponeurosporenoate glycosyltransferase n=1 Tax=Streptomyces kunmingensis TaxID=68225 RepID=A0ABU6CA40_9ACTN|nr:glycosyltransferase [Streptomyces kunmingensis]MEB3961582.1 glycosyltransferase [Streptomyces kunmingensis]